MTDAIWNTSQDWERDIARWQWGRGILIASAREQLHGGNKESWSPQTHLPTRWIVVGAMFPEAAIDAMCAQFGGLAPKETAAGGESRASRAYDPKLEWHNWVARLALLIHEEGVPPTTAPNKLIDKIFLGAADKGINVPVRSTLYPAAQKVLEALKQWADLR